TEPKAEWFLTTSDKIIKITEAMCSAEFDCPLYSKLNFDCEKFDGCTPARVSPDQSKINCSAGLELKFGDHTGSTITCNVGDGLYRDGGNFAPRGASVHCQKSKLSGGAGARRMSAATVVGIVVGSIALLIIAVITLLLCLKWRRKRKETQSTHSTTTNNEEVKTARRYDS
ncbi:hypothetical protein PFISCL1PPCAC_112, partial [Pristionchus fissidentatus]